MSAVDDAVFDDLGRSSSAMRSCCWAGATCNCWPGSGIAPSAGFQRTSKHVVTSSPSTQPWRGSVVADRASVDHVQALEAQQGGDVGVHGSIWVAQSLLQAGLVDELRPVVAPTIC